MVVSARIAGSKGSNMIESAVIMLRGKVSCVMGSCHGIIAEMLLGEIVSVMA